MSMVPTFSLIVPTLGRTMELVALFESIVASQVADLEVIVVDQNQDASLDDICLRYSKKFSLNHLKVEFKGLSRARNYGARFASGKYLNFPDDDCMLLPDTLRLAQELLDSMNLKLLAGMSVDELGSDSTTRFVRDERFLTLWNLWVRHIEFATFIDREAFVRSGGFDERFGLGSRYGADEGPELLIRLLPTLASRQAYYSHRLRFTHPNKMQDYSAKGAQRAFLYARGRGALAAKWPILPVSRAVLRYVATSALGALVFPGAKGRMYWCRLKGFFSGYWEYRQGLRERSRAGVDTKAGAHGERKLSIVFASHTPLGGPFAVGSHHLARELARAGHAVAHVSAPISLGHVVRLHQPETRIRFGLWLRGGAHCESGIFEYTPFTLFPWPLSVRFKGRRNLMLVTAPRIAKVLRRAGFSDIDFLLIDDPRFAGIETLLRPGTWAYRATDLYHQIQGRHDVTSAEKLLARGADILIATSKPVQDYLGTLAPGRSPHLIENGVELARFAHRVSAPPEYHDLRKPRMVYVGALDERVDPALLERIATRFRQASLVLVGPTTASITKRLGNLPNVALLGAKDYRLVPAYLQHADVALLPFSTHPANAARSPMKLFEYAASGLPVVSMHTPELARRSLEFLIIARTHEEFAAKLERLLLDTTLRERLAIRARDAARNMDWSSLADRLLNLFWTVRAGESRSVRALSTLEGAA